jgi:hypothetical protein
MGALPFCLGALFAAGPAFAQSPSPEDMAAARSLGTTGVQLADSGDCVSAIPKLDAAEKLFHAPTTLERLGECEIKVGRLVAGTEHLNHVVREPLPPSPPPAFVSARARAQAALGPALPRISKLRIHIDGAPAEKVTVTVDGEAVPSVLFDSDRPTDPGTHEVKAVGTGYLATTSSVTLKDSESASVSLKLDPDPNAAAAPAPPTGAATGTATGAATPGPASPAPASGGGGGKGLAIGSLVVGGVGLVVGSVFGVMALSTKSSLDSACHTKSTCPSSSQSDINSLSSNATVSTIGFGVGIVGVALGAILLATSHGSDSQAAPSPAAAAPRVTPWVGFGAAGLEGSFE